MELRLSCAKPSIFTNGLWGYDKASCPGGHYCVYYPCALSVYSSHSFEDGTWQAVSIVATAMATRGCVNINMWSYQYRDPHVKDNIMRNCPEPCRPLEWTDLGTIKSIVIFCLKCGADPPPKSLPLAQREGSPQACRNVMRWFNDCLILTWESPSLGKTVFILRQGPGDMSNWKFVWLYCFYYFFSFFLWKL